MPTDREEVIVLLKELVAVNKAILRALSPDSPQAIAARSSAVASDSDLDGSYGNPEIRKDPKRWKGATQVGRRYSECPPEFLDVLAEFLDWQAGQAESKNEMTNGGQPVAKYRRQDASRARGWAARIRAGKVEQAQTGPPPALPGPAFEEPNSGFAPGGDFTPANWR